MNVTHPSIICTCFHVAHPLYKARANYGQSNFSLLLRQQLIEEGHNLIDYGSNEVTNLGTQIKETKEELKVEEATKISNSEDIDIEKARRLNCRVTKTEQERHQIAKAFLKEELPEIELTPHFVYKAITKNNRRWLTAVKLFWNCQNPEKTYAIDKKYLKGKIINQNGVTLLSDFRTFSPKAKLINDLGFFELVDLNDPNKEYSIKDEAVIKFRDKAFFFRYKIYQSFGLTVTPKTDPIKLIEKLLDRLGLDLEQSDRRQVAGERVRFYRLKGEKLLDPDRLSVLASLDKKHSQIVTGKDVQSGQDSQIIIYTGESCPLENENQISHQDVSQDSSKIIYINESPVTAKTKAASSLEPSQSSKKEEKNHDIIQNEIQEPNMLNPNLYDAESNLTSVHLENGTLFKVGDQAILPIGVIAKIIQIKSEEKVKLEGYDHWFSGYSLKAV